ncbi:MAG: Cbp1 family collagen-binding glycoprotein adhesin [Candidatus Scalindua sp.]
MRKYILISIILVCVFGCSNEDLEVKIKVLENENKDLGLKLQKQSTELESSSGVVKDVTALLKNIEETEIRIEEKKHILRSAEEVESTVDMKEEILNSIQELYDDLKRHREKAVELQEKLDSLAAGDTQMNEIISSLKIALKEKTIKVEDLSKKNFSLKKHVTNLENKQGELTYKISHLKSELNFKVKEVSSKELEIKDLHEKLNNVFYIIGNRRELRRKKIIVKKGIPLLRSLNPFSRNYVLGQDFTLAEFKKEKTLRTKFRIDGKIIKILPYRSKNNYDITYENRMSFININDSKKFWRQKYLVIVTR